MGASAASRPLLIVSLAENAPLIPAASAEDERSINFAGFTLDRRRTRLDANNFGSEYRIRRLLTAGSNPRHQEGQQFRLELVKQRHELYRNAVAQNCSDSVFDKLFM